MVDGRRQVPRRKNSFLTPFPPPPWQSLSPCFQLVPVNSTTETLEQETSESRSHETSLFLLLILLLAKMKHKR